MEILIKKAEIQDLKRVQELNLELFKKEYKEYDNLLNLDYTFWKTGTKYYKDRIIKDDWCIYICKINNKIIGYICWAISKGEDYRNLPIMAEK